MEVFQANVIGHFIDSDRPVGTAPLLVGDEGVVILYGDPEGVSVVLAAPDENEAERRILATFGTDTFGLPIRRGRSPYIDELVPTVPRDGTMSEFCVFERGKVGLTNIAHAVTRCTDPDCEIHHPEVIEDMTKALTAMAWFEAGRRDALHPVGPYAGQEGVCEDCGKELSEGNERSSEPTLCDSCATQRNYDRASS